MAVAAWARVAGQQRSWGRTQHVGRLHQHVAQLHALHALHACPPPLALQCTRWSRPVAPCCWGCAMRAALPLPLPQPRPNLSAQCNALWYGMRAPGQGGGDTCCSRRRAAGSVERVPSPEGLFAPKQPNAILLTSSSSWRALCACPLVPRCALLAACAGHVPHARAGEQGGGGWRRVPWRGV